MSHLPFWHCRESRRLRRKTERELNEKRTSWVCHGVLAERSQLVPSESHRSIAFTSSAASVSDLN